MPSLFDPIRLGAIDAPNRIFMAPLTRARATREHVPTPMMVEYYTQRAGAGLILSEATGISREGTGWPFCPGIWTDAQVEAWKPVVDAVHRAGGRILCQLWHMGRIVHPDFLGGAQPVSASATTAPDQAHTYDGKKPYTQARPLGLDEIPRLLGDYERAARNAIAAGFDGVQIHAANGYLIDQFLRDGSNLRDDAYGGSIENRVRLLAEVTQAVAGTVGPERTAVRLSPNGEIQGVDDSNPEALFGAAASALAKVGIAFLELREPGPNGTFGTSNRPPIAPAIKRSFGGPLVLNSDYDGPRAEAALEAGEADAIAFGRPFIANPDLPARLAKGAALNKDDAKTWYSQGRAGYLDYPTLAEANAA
ncbi:alkene reductase [uncultured Methylobacterium sp.]|uniref:alkene reductase n=1 Tax=uncultured Methylobacterium sp. TaxID=157278 RepID=UPI0035CC2E8E